MGALTLYALKSAVVLAVLYLPYTLLLKRETFFALNRGVLLGIVVLSLVVPCLDIPVWHSDLSDRLASQGESLRAVTLPAVVVTAAEAQADAQLHQTDHSDLYLMYALVGLYMAGLVVCLAWKAFNLLRLVRFMSSGCLWTDKRDGMTIHCHAERVTPFSWMRNIVINEADDDDRSPVLLHETAHVRLRHSWDTLLLSLAEAVQWFNPCIWMMDDSLREVHEYEADDAVLRRGIPAESYQLLLIRKTVGEQRFAMANAFNHSLLKNRITMMNRKKSSKWASAKMLYIVPVTLACLNAFASATATEQEEKVTADPRPQLIVDSQSSGVDNDKQKHIETADIASVPVLKDKHAASAEHKAHNTIVITTEAEAPSAAPEDSTVYDVPEKAAEFPGGTSEVFKWLSKNIRYPQEALEWGIQGRVLVQFIVEADGKVSNAQIIEKNGESMESLNEIVVAAEGKDLSDAPEEQARVGQAKGKIAFRKEALRVVNAMPDWQPARDKGKPVRSKFVLPITFRLT